MARNQCNSCGAYLDPEERCDCKKTEMIRPHKKIFIGPSGKGCKFLKIYRK